MSISTLLVACMMLFAGTYITPHGNESTDGINDEFIDEAESYQCFEMEKEDGDEDCEDEKTLFRKARLPSSIVRRFRHMRLWRSKKPEKTDIILEQIKQIITKMEEEQKSLLDRIARSETNFNDNHGVVVSGSDNDVTIRIDKDGVKVGNIDHNETKVVSLVRELPKNLQGEKAITILDKLVGANILDENYQPMNLTGPEKAILASRVSYKLWGCNKWSIWEELWGCQNKLRQYNQRALDSSSYAEFESEIKSLC